MSATIAAVAVSLASATTSYADPQQTAAQAQSKLDALSAKAEILTENYDAAQTRLDSAQRALAADREAVSAAAAAVDAARAQVAGLAVAAYRGAGVDTLAAVLSAEDPQLAFQRADYLALLTEQRGEILRGATAAQTRLDGAQQLASQQLAQIRALQASLAAQQKTISSLVAEQEALVKLTEQQAALAAGRTPSQAASRSQSRAPAPVYSGPADGRAAAAVRYAYAQLGKPYRWGGAGPGSFDCSGLVMRAWQAAGVSLPHNAAMQYASTRHVSLANLQPGDLIYFGRPIHHVGIYIGGGKMIEAPYTGADVRINSFGYRRDIAGASRP